MPNATATAMEPQPMEIYVAAEQAHCVNRVAVLLCNFIRIFLESIEQKKKMTRVVAK